MLMVVPLSRLLLATLLLKPLNVHPFPHLLMDSTIDHLFFPHIVDNIQDEMELEALLKMRETSSRYRSPKNDHRVRCLLSKQLGLCAAESGRYGEFELRFLSSNIPGFMAAEKIQLPVQARPRSGPAPPLILPKATTSPLARTQVLALNSSWTALERFPPLPNLRTIWVKCGGGNELSRPPPLPPCSTVYISPLYLSAASVIISPSKVKRVVFLGNCTKGGRCVVDFTPGEKLQQLVFVHYPEPGIRRLSMHNTGHSVMAMLVGLVTGSGAIVVRQILLVGVGISEYDAASRAAIARLNPQDQKVMKSIKVLVCSFDAFTIMMGKWAKGK